MAVTVRFFSLSGPYKRVKTQAFDTSALALEAVKAYAEAGGYTNVRLVDGDDPYDGFRFTAKTPGGRSGRNVAYGDWDGLDACDGGF